MKVHANAPLGPKGRETMVRRVVDDGWSHPDAAHAAGVSEKTCRKWVSRYLAEGLDGLMDRSSAPQHVPHRTPEELVEVVAMLRRLRMTGAEIAFCLAMALSTVSAVLLRIGLGKLSRLEPPEPPNRYERRHPGELIHIDVKKLGRIVDGAGHRVHGARAKQRRRTRDGRRTTAGSSSTSASTMRPAWPTSKCSPTNKARPPPGFCAARSRSMPPTASPCSA